MNVESYSFKIGAFQCTLLKDATHGYQHPAKLLFQNAPYEMMRQILLGHQGEYLWYLSDAFLHPVHIEQPDWYAEVDIQPQQTVNTRKRLLKQAIIEQPLIQCFHFPFPGLGYIYKSKERYYWRQFSAEDND